MLELPKFKYFLNPLENKIFKKSSEKCDVCSKKTGYIYEGSIYSEREVENICPWCIANGRAAKEYEGTFNDETCIDEVNQEYIDELIYRTPEYISWQSAYWPSHCGDICAFEKYVGWKEIADIKDELKDDIESIKEDFGFTQQELEKSLVDGGSLQGYLFKCVKCGKHRILTDCD